MLNLAEIEEVNLLRRDSDRTNSNWMFAIHSHNRNELLNYLRSVGVGAVVHNRRNDKYSVFGGLRKDLPNLDRVDKTLLNLPIHHGVTEQDAYFIVNQIKEFYAR